MLRQIRAWAILVLVASASFFVTPASAHSNDYAESIKKLQLLDARVQNIGHARPYLCVQNVGRVRPKFGRMRPTFSRVRPTNRDV